MSKTLLIDAGHGGMIGNDYMTSLEKGRFFEHSDLADSFIIYEGVINRLIKDKIIVLFKAWRLQIVDICPTELDLSIGARKTIINRVSREIPGCVVLSLHSNASLVPGQGHGFELFTTVGDTSADPLAEKLGWRLMGDFPQDRFRPNHRSKLGKEHDYGILKCVPPAILLESLFYDNYEDAKKLMSVNYRNRIAECIVDWFSKL